MTTLGVVMPYWLDRPDEEAVEIAVAAEQAGIETVWVGEMASFDAFALATAIGLRTERARLKVGPLPVGVRSPVAIALGVASVATLTGRHVDVALGASSPAIVSAWHDRPWTALGPRTRETVLALRDLLHGERIDLDGEHVRAHGFRLRRPQPDATITVAAFGPTMTRIAARYADEVVLNLVSVEHVAAVRARIDAEAAAVGRAAPRLAVWVAAALDPGPQAGVQLAGQVAVYLGAPGYGEMFADLGFGELVERARAGARRSELVAAVPRELWARVAAVGSASEIAARLAAYHDAGADHVAIGPSTAEDPGGRRVPRSLAQQGET
ncbi:MAG TPA: LLM class F420-dependent oxidoreductase [Solirubrobacteraceae bacterium]|nr:LLM class F420-dependent oxidoreductase [Solirubrobacteraceae bacterium]